MTNTTDFPPAPPRVRQLRRSRGDRVISGVAGGLGDYFTVDAVIFRVLFAVLSFFGGVGLLLYALAWLLVPEPDVETSVLDRAIEHLRLRRTPPWLVVIGAAVVLWLGWFSWWAPGPTLPAMLLLAVLGLVLLNRMGRPSTPPAVSLEKEQPTEPLIAPLNDTRRSMQAWLAEAGEAHRNRVRRRRPIKLGVALSLAAAWAVVAVVDAFHRVPFPAYLWTGLAVLVTGLAISLITRRMTLSLLLPIAVLTLATIALGGTRASLHDGAGQVSRRPGSVAALADHRQFAGQFTLDLTDLRGVTSPASVTLTQAAGEVVVRVPATANVTVTTRVHLGIAEDVSVADRSGSVSGLNVNSDFPPADGVTGVPITVHVDLTVGHVLIDRVG